MRLFTLSDTPRLEKLNEIYNRSLRIRSLAETTPPPNVNAAPYLRSFFKALIAELYTDPFFQQKIGDVLKVRTAMDMRRSLAEVAATLHRISENLTNNYTIQQFERDVREYLTHTERILHYHKLVGIVPDRGVENRDPELGGIFVPLYIARLDTSLEGKQPPTTIQALLNASQQVVLLGGPGSGKSTLTRYLAWSHTLVNLPKSSDDFSIIPSLPGKPIPLRIELRRLADDRRQHPHYNFLSYATEVLLEREGVGVNVQMFKELLERRAMLLLFDGLDEVPTIDERKRLVEEIEHFTSRYPGNRTVVSSRPVGYELAPFSNEWFSHAQIQAFNDEQIRQFLECWYTNVLRLSPLPHSDQQELEGLVKTLKENVRLHKLAENPLLLSVITILHRYERLPDRRVLVYDRCADLLLEKWAKIKGTATRWGDMKMIREDQYACIAHLGFALHERSQEKAKDRAQAKNAGPSSLIEEVATDVPTRFLLQETERFLKSRNLITEVAEQRAEAKRFLELVQIEAGLIVERGKDEAGTGLYGFVHRTFQEYFAAADVHERYLQQEKATIISKFLVECLHDPHWHEVILLLLAKLKHAPVTRQLRQVLEGTIKSNRSQYTDIVQQDLFFVCECLSEEIAVEHQLAQDAISCLGNLVKCSPFPSQRTEALNYLRILSDTRQYSVLAREELAGLRALLTQHGIQGIDTKIRIAETLYQDSHGASIEQQRAFQILLELTHHPNFPVEQGFEAVKKLYYSSPEASEERRLATQILLHLAQRPDLSFRQAVYAIREYFHRSPKGQAECQLASKILLRFAQRPDLPFERAMGVGIYFYIVGFGNHHYKKIVTPMLLDIAQRPDLPIEQAIQAAYTLYRWSLENSAEQQFASQRLLDLARRLDLSVGQIVQTGQSSNDSSSKESAEQQLATQMLLNIAQRFDLPTEQAIRAAHALYQCSPEKSAAQQFASQRLLDLARRPDLPVGQTFQVAQSLYLSSSEGSQQRQYATKLLLKLARNQNLSTDQRLSTAIPLIETTFTECLRESSIHTTMFVKYADLLQTVRVLDILLPKEDGKQILTEYWDWRLEIPSPGICRKTDRGTGEIIETSVEKKVAPSDIPYLVELVKQDLLPTEARDFMFQLLRQMVPQFGRVGTRAADSSPEQRSKTSTSKVKKKQ